MRYDSLFNSKKWPSDSSKGLVTPIVWPSHSVKLLYVLPNYPFSNLDCLGLEWPNFMKFHLVVSKCPKFKNWAKIFNMPIDFIYFRPHFIYFRPPKLCVFFWAFWVVPALTKLAPHFGLSLSYFLLDIRLLYPHLRGYLGLSYELNCLNFPGLVRVNNKKSPFKSYAPPIVQCFTF